MIGEDKRVKPLKFELAVSILAQHCPVVPLLTFNRYKRCVNVSLGHEARLV